MSEQVIHKAAAQELNADFRGQVLNPGEPAYEATKEHVFNGMFRDRNPALIAQCAAVDDVMAAVAFGQRHGLEIAVRGGGHSVAGHSTTDGGLLIDLSPMKKIDVDPDARSVRAEAGVTWGEFDAATQEHGLATTGGRVTTTGIAGLTLGSGSGWLERKFGYVIDNLLSAEVVMADGRIVNASRDNNGDLFWGLRGGGGNFGIVTSFEYRLHELGPTVLGGLLAYPRDDAAVVVRGWRDVMSSAPDELCSGLVFLTAPPLPFVPEDLQLQPAVGIFFLWAGPPDDGEEAAKTMRGIAPAAVDVIDRVPYTFLQSLLDPANPPGRGHYWKSEHLPEITDDVLDTLIAQSNKITSPFSVVIVEPKRGAISRVDEDDAAIGRRDVAATFYGVAQWEDPAMADAEIAWVHGFGTAMEPFATTGAAPNFNMDEGEARVRSTFGPKYDRLVELKRRYDPNNVFHLNQNIKP